MSNIQSAVVFVLHALAQGLIWFGPLLIAQIPPSIGSLTISGAISILVAWFTHRYVATQTAAAVSAGRY